MFWLDQEKMGLKGTTAMTYKGHVENGVIVLDEPTVLPEGAEVRVELTEGAREKADKPKRRSHYERTKHLVGSMDDLPVDFAANHDYYIHATSKRS